MQRYERAAALASDGLGFKRILLETVLFPFNSTAIASMRLIGNGGTGLGFVVIMSSS
jgi:hypothetical protein